MKLCVLVIVQKCSRHLAPCHTLLFWWAAHFHLVFAFFLFPRHDLPQLILFSFPARLNLAQIRDMWVLAMWPNPQFHRLWAQAFCRRQEACRTRGFTCPTIILPQTEHSFDMQFCREHWDAHLLESDLDDDQIRALLVWPLYLQEREANADRPQVDHSVGENLVSSSSQVPKSTERPVTLFSSENRSNQETFSDRRFFFRRSTGFWEQWIFVPILWSGKFNEIALLRVTEIMCLRKRNLKLCWPECKVDSLFAFVNFNNKLNPIG